MPVTLCPSTSPHVTHGDCPGRSQFYTTGDEDGPRILGSYTGPHHGLIRPGDQVVYENPAWQQDDGTYLTGGMDGTMTVTELVDLGDGLVQAILCDGEWECSAANLRATPLGETWPRCVVCGFPVEAAELADAGAVHHRRYLSRGGDGRPANGVVVQPGEACPGQPGEARPGQPAEARPSLTAGDRVRFAGTAYTGYATQGTVTGPNEVPGMVNVRFEAEDHVYIKPLPGKVLTRVEAADEH